MLWSPLTSLPKVDGSAPQLAATGNIHPKTLQVHDSHKKTENADASIKAVKDWSRVNGVIG